MINIETYSQVEIKIGHILEAEKIPDTDKLLKLKVDMGFKPLQEGETVAQPDIRQIVSGISAYYPDPQVLVGVKCAFVANLEPRMLRGLESQGMILATSTEDGKFSLLRVSDDIPAGSKVK